MGIRPYFAVFIIACAGLTGCFEATQAPAPVARYSVGAGAGTTGIHTALKGETLWLISKRYNIAARDIAVVNNLQAPFVLTPGQRLKLPPPQQYTARLGDSLTTVSRLFGVNRSEIAKMNNIREPYTLRPGQVLRLPSITKISEPQVFAQERSPFYISSEPSGVGGDVVAEPLSAPPVVKIDEPDRIASAVVDVPPEQERREIKSVQPKSPVTAKIPKRSSKKFMKPVKGKMLSGYGPKASGLFNDGMNISAASGAPVKAAENGVVVYAGDELKGSGNLILIRHEDRWVTAYAHLSNIAIKRGDVVKRGQVIGAVGSTGSVDTPQLHFEVRRGTEALNPEVYLES